MDFNKNSKTIKSILMTTLVILMLIISGPASAVTIGIAGLDGTSTTQGSALEFQVTTQIDAADSYLPVTNLSLIINGATSRNCVFSLNGDEISGCDDITISPPISASSNAYGYGHGFGYDYVLGGLSNFGYGYGYGYNNGAGGGTLTYTYNISLTTASFIADTYTATMNLNTGESIKPTFSSDTASFTITSPPMSGGHGGSGTGGVLNLVSNNGTGTGTDTGTGTGTDTGTETVTDVEEPESVTDIKVPETASNEDDAGADEKKGLLPGFGFAFTLAGLLVTGIALRRRKG